MRRSQPGAPPGTIVVHPHFKKPTIRAIAYDAQKVFDKEISGLEEADALLSQYRVVWLDIVGLGSESLIRQIGRRFHLHALSLEDVVNVHQRPKVESYDDHLFVCCQMVHPEIESLDLEQLSLFVGKGFVITFQERPGDSLQPVRERIHANRGQLRKLDSDYLAYALVDAVIDSFFPIIDRYAVLLEELEDRIETMRDPHSFSQIHDIRDDLLLLRRSISSHWKMLGTLTREAHSLITNETVLFFRDCLDHTVQLLEWTEIYRESCNNLKDYHLTLVGHRSNEVMKVLTIIATLFMPLSFIAGLYGMNFDRSSPWNMPELGWRFGYLFAITLMIGTALSMGIMFWRKGWILSRRDP